jgi:hypothetical protein
MAPDFSGAIYSIKTGNLQLLAVHEAYCKEVEGTKRAVCTA